jgi:GH15 family glucan-1,4-alpha-glucosidase
MSDGTAARLRERSVGPERSSPIIKGMTGAGSYPPISDYGLIGDSRACALVSKDGSIDWLCLPRPDSPSIFGRILDWERGGYFQIAPQTEYEALRRYIPGTNVLETTFKAAEGTVVMTDFMPALTEKSKSASLHPLRAVFRMVECTRGQVPMRFEFQPRPGYGRDRAALQARGRNSITVSARNHVLMLKSDTPLTADAAGASGDFMAVHGQVLNFSLSYSEGEPVVILADDYALKVKAETIAFWEDWSRDFSYNGSWRDQVLRSALALKLLSYAPSGAVLAAPTTSLPEVVGGERNWDYRYCWPRDAAFSVKALLSLGFEEEAQSFFAWLLHATRLKLPRLQPLYSILGESHLKERTLERWNGYRDSRPIRVGNAASSQTQLDVYGELIDAAHTFLLRRGRDYRISRDEAGFLESIVNHVATTWRQPDSGIWEPRIPPQQYTHSKVMAWVALNRAVDLGVKGFISGPLDWWRREADLIRETVLTSGYNEEMRSFTQTFGGRTLDAALLTLPLVGFLPPRNERILSTLAAIRKGLDEDGFLRRYANFDDGLSGDEGAFLICNFWLVGALARCGELDEAKRVFELTLTSANDLLLLAEEYDPASKAHLGNFPQAFSHLGLIMAALEISEAEGNSP